MAIRFFFALNSLLMEYSHTLFIAESELHFRCLDDQTFLIILQNDIHFFKLKFLFYHRYHSIIIILYYNFYHFRARNKLKQIIKFSSVRSFGFV